MPKPEPPAPAASYLDTSVLGATPERSLRGEVIRGSSAVTPRTTAKPRDSAAAPAPPQRG